MSAITIAKGGFQEAVVSQYQRLNNLTPAAGERHDEGNMAIINR